MAAMQIQQHSPIAGTGGGIFATAPAFSATTIPAIDTGGASEPVWAEARTAEGASYYFSRVADAAQWTPPPWLDYVHEGSGQIYYWRGQLANWSLSRMVREAEDP